MPNFQDSLKPGGILTKWVMVRPFSICGGFMIHAYILFIISLLLTQGLYAHPSFELSSTIEGEALGLYFETLEDPDGRLTLEDVLRIEASGGLTPSPIASPNYGQNSAIQWVKFTLHNPSVQPIVVLLEDKFVYVDDFRIYHQNAERQWLTRSAGDQLPFANRDIKTRQVVFRFTIAPGSQVFYARSFTSGSHQLPLHIWTPDEFFQSNAREYGYIGILVGFHVVICLYNLFLYFSLRDRTYLMYVLYVAGNLVFQGFFTGVFQQMLSELSIVEYIPNEIMVMIVDVISITALSFSYQFLNLKKRAPWFKLPYQIVGALSLANMILTVTVSDRLGTSICLITASMATSVLMTSGFVVARKGYLPAVFYLAAWGCYLCGVTLNVSNLLGFLPTSLFTRWGQFTGGAFEIALLSLALGARINEKRRRTMLEIQELNTDLEGKVKERTAEIHSLLLHIPQGILSIGAHGLVGHNFSAQLPFILEQADIAGQSFRRIVLDRSTLSEDEKDQIWQTLLASIGETSLNFELNMDKLPVQIDYIFAGKRKVLRLTWNNELLANDEIKHILVTLLDISAEVAAQHEVERQNQEFEIIKQLVDLGGSKSSQFFSTADQLMEENDRLVHAQVLHVDTIKILFVNTHTLKGAARTLALKELANEFHKVEGYYAGILKDAVAIDPRRIQQEFAETQAVYQRYLRANREILGRRDDLKKVAVDREFLQENVRLLRHLTDLDGLSGDLREIIHNFRHELTQLIFMSLPVVLAEIMLHAEKIARDLSREPPIIQLDADDILITYSQELALKNIFIHLLRNALDHGIEPARERLANGKPAQGTLAVKAWEDEGSILIEFKDDGRGLAVGKIRELCRAGDAAAELVAAKVFETGFSTSETVSIISGRGVGLGAVRQFLESEKGDATVVLGRVIREQGELYEFTIRMRLPAREATACRAIKAAS